ncbi:MAG: type II toxin-antitoxin system VapC family toxin [Sandaracinaceae bacterium]|nr:type II toxin-antitoxin system VapC family toxin [Sandaracinaceae bacterium]
MIVLDASAALELLLATPVGLSVAGRISDLDETLHAPHVIDLEVAQVLRRYVRSGVVRLDEAEAALMDLAELDLHRYAHVPLFPRLWQLRENLSAYDAAYVALAEALGAALLTTDARLAGAPGHDAKVEVIGP